MRQALIIAGPTASGKSALALMLAQRLGGTVINADSMQVYREVPIVTAQPGASDRAAVPHRLYGIRPAAEPGSVAWWRREALAAMEDAALPILCGGTGLYLQSLTAGLADIPEPEPEHRAEARALVAAEGPAAMHARLAAVDPETAAGLRPSDPQRLARAWEVWRSTGRGLAAWQRAAGVPVPYAFRSIVLEPPREALWVSVASRFDAMLAAGALDEVAALCALDLDPAVPALRALGVPELSAVVQGQTTLADARQQAIAASMRYVKRQTTWFRNRKIGDPAMTRKIMSLWSSETQDRESWIESFSGFVSGRD